MHGAVVSRKAPLDGLFNGVLRSRDAKTQTVKNEQAGIHPTGFGQRFSPQGRSHVLTSQELYSVLHWRFCWMLWDPSNLIKGWEKLNKHNVKILWKKNNKKQPTNQNKKPVKVPNLLCLICDNSWALELGICWPCFLFKVTINKKIWVAKWTELSNNWNKSAWGKAEKISVFSFHSLSLLS